MAADTFHVIFGIGNEHLGVIRIGAVGRVGQPKVLPDHDAVAVAGFVKLFVTDHADPVTHHREVHIGVIGHRDVVFATAIVQVRLTKTPVSAATDKATSVDEEAQYTVIFIKRHLTDAGFEVTCIGYLIADFKRKVRVVKIRSAVPFRPPQARMSHVQLRISCRVENDCFFFARSQLDRLFKRDFADFAFERTLHGFCIPVPDDDAGRQLGRGRIGQGKYGAHKRIGDGDMARRCERYVVPYSDVASAHGRNPVPSDRCMERRIIGAQNTSVKVGALTVLLFDGADVRILHNLDRNHILPRNDKVGHVELAPHESSLDTSQFVAVQIHVGFPVDTVEIEEQTILFEVFG